MLNIKMEPSDILKRVAELTISNPVNKLVIPRKNYAYFNTFKETPLHERITTSQKIKKKYRGRVPIIVDSSDNIEFEKYKYIVSLESTVGEFLYELKRRIKLNPCESIFLLTNNTLLSNSDNISVIYKQFKSVDEFLYIIVSKENVFGVL